MHIINFTMSTIPLCDSSVLQFSSVQIGLMSVCLSLMHYVTHIHMAQWTTTDAYMDVLVILSLAVIMSVSLLAAMAGTGFEHH